MLISFKFTKSQRILAYLPLFLSKIIVEKIQHSIEKIQESQNKSVAASVQALSAEDMADEVISTEMSSLIDEEVESL